MVEIVDLKQLKETRLEMRLKMQLKNISSLQLKDKLFSNYQKDQEVKIKQLQELF